MFGVEKQTVELSEYSVEIISPKKKKRKLHENQFYMNVNRRENMHQLIRYKTYFTGSKSKVLNSKIILQYVINRKICEDKEELQYTVPRHGNANVETPFFPLKKSTLEKFKKQVSGEGKRAVSIAHNNAAQSGNEGNDFGDLPRSKKQLIDLSCFPFADNEACDILAYNEKLGDKSILWHHSDIPEDLYVIGTNSIASEMSNAASFKHISVDPTFNLGVFDVTPFTYRSFIFQCKSKNTAQKWVPATMIEQTIIQHSKAADT